MSRLTNQVIDATTLLGNSAFGRVTNAPMVNPTFGGQFGWAPDLTRWISNQAYIRRNLICIVLEAPRFFQAMPDSRTWVQTLKAMFELHARTIEGFNAGLTVEPVEHAMGGGGEMFQEFVDVKRARSEPQISLTEKYGRPFQTFLHQWIQYGLADPDTKYALVGTLEDYPEDMLADRYAASAIFIEPDPTHRKVVKAWLTTNMWPLSTGDIIGKKDQTSGSELTELNITFAGISQVGYGVDLYAQEILNSINITQANPYLRPAFINGKDSHVAAAMSSGYQEGVDNLAASTINAP